MVDLLQIVENLVALVRPFGFVLYGLCFVFGVIFVLSGLRRASKRAETGPNMGSYGKPFSHLLTGIVLISLPALLASLTQTFFGMDTPSADRVFEYAPATVSLFEAGSPARQIITGMVVIIQFIGVIAVIRGLTLLNQSAQGDGGPCTFGPGVTFIIAGVMAVNFPLFIGAVERLITNTA